MGKVHGSLARAGKVKSQTPKMDGEKESPPGDAGRCAADWTMETPERLDADQVCIQQVEPQEKKKNPKGRALKRIKYTRRFVNVTMTGGKRKMNPNPTS
ncbi:40s ribosomal protein s30 [Diplodia corticola]|uniref:40s ribosomal protein s30 n=1 Tax=Diplodia corticola TaxID=236234 RepID=A0A1J9S6N9_9PEZI|nr:40s ribosomal protein s30 [Diplodia corticola]OJD35277.1 40s ribosomal protein s30 [Diplodia corticola]